jgi:hypothetical protein
MSEFIFNHFFSMLKMGKIDNLITLFYNEQIFLSINNDEKVIQKNTANKIWLRATRNVHILQFKIVDIIKKGNKLSYKIYLITKNKENSIDFSLHSVTNKWEDNLITQHKHIIINH